MVCSPHKKFAKPDQRAFSMIAIRPEMSGVKQLDDSIGDTFVSGVLKEVSFALVDFQTSWMKKAASGRNTRQSIRKYGRYHRPIARPALFWLNDRGGKSHGGCERI
jgi:hypothetical protein